MRLNQTTKQHGLTLLEVMVALLIFAVTGSAILKAAGDHLSGVRLIQDMTFATWVANNRLTALQLEDTWPPKNNAKGSQEMAGTMWYWSQRVEKTTDEDLMLVEVTVATEANSKNSITSVSTYLAKKPQS
ncbi:type II secretion system minor pseudopilin GspI [Paraglaciecola sp.]|uniref:type II secretion system minor pseudopilin GspI n=1 Tax=Paraglaciecola sp. TaxID=1920173 RepID=UPI00273F2015|nr:type II secretion system minor pseudopilin GspI [Paraglaciecola sp.]MDP5030411.1 type II secretion system minor pseudopilin GspI [Paraglaciecola sp.]